MRFPDLRVRHARSCLDEQADAVEVFIAPWSSAVPQRYFEMEISPRGVLFVSRIVNPKDTCSGIQNTLLDCVASGIEWGGDLLCLRASTYQLPFPCSQEHDPRLAISHGSSVVPHL